jgi:hypothetical protein
MVIKLRVKVILLIIKYYDYFFQRRETMEFLSVKGIIIYSQKKKMFANLH